MLNSVSKHKGRKFFCKRCLQHFYDMKVLNEHKKNCIEINGTQSVEMPSPNSYVYFKNYYKKIPVPFVIYADFESITEKLDIVTHNENKPCTEKYQSHKPYSFAYKLVCYNDDTYSKPLEMGHGCIKKFLNQLIEEVKYCKDTYLQVVQQWKLEKDFMKRIMNLLKNTLNAVYVIKTLTLLIKWCTLIQSQILTKELLVVNHVYQVQNKKSIL